MSLRSYYFVLFIIWLTSGMSVALLFFYMNPMSNPELALTLFGIGTFLLIGSTLTMFLFFFKKIYYRGDVNFSTMNASIRQGIFLSIGLVMSGIFYIFSIREPKMMLAIWATIGCIEVMIQAIE